MATGESIVRKRTDIFVGVDKTCKWYVASIVLYLRMAAVDSVGDG